MVNLQAFLESAGYKTRSYSGRGMYGKECLAVKIDDYGNFIGDLLCEAADAFDSQDVFDIADIIRDMREDSLGHSIVVYWKHIQYIGDPYEEEDYEEEE